ncbi:MAG: hypothetical protein ACI4J0_05815 [Huintestinicola sp.]|uniref:hypothetical protein n=1 Tax=Huintestinicola sp. TaxID=2981661 RepID=UPI003EFBDFBF
MMNKKFGAICFAAIMLTACGADKAAPEVTETEQTTASVTETASEAQPESVSETTAEAITKNETATETEPPDTSDDYKALYKEKLSEIRETEEYEPSISTFDLYDIDNDGTPELFAANGNYHAATVRLYTVKDGECVCLDNPAGDNDFNETLGFGSWGMAQAAEGGYIASRYSGMGSGYADYYRLEKGELTHLVSSEHHMYSDESEDERDKFVIDGNEVSEEEYSEAVGKYQVMDWTDVGQGYRFFDMDEAEKVLDNYGK